MKVIVLKAFPYAHDGLTVRDLTPSDRDPPATEEVRDELIAGLVAAGYVSTGQGDSHARQSETQADQAAADVYAGAAEVVATARDGQPVVEGERPPLTDIPADWQKSHHKTRVALAKKISGSDVANADEADKVIAAEVARRAGE